MEPLRCGLVVTRAAATSAPEFLWVCVSLHLHAAASLPGPRPLQAGSRDHTGLRGYSPPGLLHAGPFDLRLPSGRGRDGSRRWGSGGGGGGRWCWLLGAHLAYPGDHHWRGRTSLGCKELQGAGEGICAAS